MEFSIGNLWIKHIRKTTLGFKLIELHHNSRTVAVFYLHSRYAPDIEIEDAVIINKSFKELHQKIKPYLGKGQKFSSHNKNVKTRALLLVYCLLDLEKIVKQYKLIEKDLGKGGYHIIGSRGGSFVFEDKYNPKTFFTYKPAYVRSNTSAGAVARARIIQRKEQEKLGRYTSVAVLDGLMDWNLSIREYAGFIRPLDD